MLTKKVEKVENIFHCECCDYSSSRSDVFKKHLLTGKHNKANKLLTNANEKLEKVEKKYNCICGNEYIHNSSFSRHKKNCELLHNDVDKSVDKSIDDTTALMDNNSIIIEFLKQNQEFQKQFLELVKDKSIGNTTNNNTTNNTNSNNSFNLNLFLNETCKGALNISEFIETIKVQLQDLERVGKLGYVEGITDIIIRGLKELDVTKRPIHCSDIKRETLYVKNDNIWENDTDKEKMKYTIQHVAGKNFKQIHEWIKENPDSKDSETKKHDEYMRIINKSTGGMTEEEDNNNYTKIIKKVASEVTINKEN
jgi:hypothetical protein